MNINRIYIHPIYLKEGDRDQFFCGHDIAVAEVEKNKPQFNYNDYRTKIKN